MRVVNASAPGFEGGMDRIENVTEDDDRSAETVRQRIEAVQRASAQSRKLGSNLVRDLFMSVLQDLRNALDGKVDGMSVRYVGETLDDLVGLLRGESSLH